MRQMPLPRRVAAICVFVVAFCWPLAAATVSKLNDDVLAPLRGPVVAKRILLNNVPLYAHGTARIELEEFQVWAPGGKVIVTDGKSVQYLDPPPMRFFRGLVNGDPESFAYFSVDGTTGAISGLMATRDGKFAVDASRRRPLVRPHAGIGNDPIGDYDYFLTAMDDSDAIPMTGQTWTCEVEKLPVIPNLNRRILAETDASGHPVIALGISGTQSYAIAVEVETDDELYANAGSNVTTATNYITNLSGAVSTIYNRDIHTNVVQQNVHIYTGGPGTDPWTATNASAGLTELGDYYHANHSTLKRSAVVMMSGKATLSGIAWEGVICGGDFSTGSDFGGSYAWCGSIGGLSGPGIGTIPDPNATTNGTLYGMPTGGNNFWPLEEYAHELGHNLAGHHTHCVAISSAEAAGTNHPSQLFIDMCHTGEVEQSTPFGACATGPDLSSAPTEKGTIMSYCHEVFAGSVPQSRYTFGQASEVSHHELDDYMLRAPVPLPPYGGGINIVTATGTFSMSSISGSSTVAPNSTGNVASVTPVNGGSVTYSWTITGGTITSSPTISSITYTAGASGSVVLRATLYNTNGCGVTDTKTVTIVTCTAPAISTQPQSVGVPAGTGVTLSVGATGTSLTYQWYIGTSGVTTTPIGGATAASVNVTPSSTTTYWVRVSNSCGTMDSAAATVTVTPVAAASFYLLSPCRILDTRGGAPVPANGVMNLVVTGKCAVAAGATSAAVNVTVVNPSTSGFVTLYPGPANTVLPVVSTINYTPGRTLANNARITVGVDGSINIFNAASQPLNFLIDVSGYFK
jgi:hypothetical protein